MITGAAKVAGVVGWPVAHSLSPLIHNAWIDALGWDAVYLPFAVAPERFNDFIDGVRATNVRGLNVTLPHKLAAIRVADWSDDSAATAGAANTLVFDGPRVQAHNTDGDGLRRALSQGARNWEAEDRPVLLLGAGGAARGAIEALELLGASEIRVAARRIEAAQQLADELASELITVHSFDRLDRASEDVVAVVNATSAGLNGRGDLPPTTAVPSDAVFMDMVYKPLRTAFLERAASRGHVTVDGLSMLIGQAEQSFQAFFGQFPPKEVDVRALCLQALGETV
jgi:shikimate dehydrogenase